MHSDQSPYVMNWAKRYLIINYQSMENLGIEMSGLC